MIPARVDWDGSWFGPLAPELHGVPPAQWTAVRWLEGRRRDVSRGLVLAHRLRARGWPAPRPLGCLRGPSLDRLLLSDDAEPLPGFIDRGAAESLGRLLQLLSELRIRAPALDWSQLGLRYGEVVPLNLLGARRSWGSPTPKHLRQLFRPDLNPRVVLIGLRRAAADRPQPKDWARQWFRALARGETRSSGV